MDIKNVKVIESKAGFSVVRLDFHHTRGDTMLYGIVAGEVGDVIPHESDIRFFLTMRVASLALEGWTQVGREGPAGGKSYEEMLAILEKQV